MAFTTSGQETEWALFLQPRSPHGVSVANIIHGIHNKRGSLFVIISPPNLNRFKGYLHRYNNTSY